MNTRGCVTEGEELFYDPPCLSFAVAKGSVESLGVSDQDFLEVVDEAFQRWADVDCGNGEGPGFKFATAGLVEASGKFFCEDSPTLNMSVWTTSDPWGYEQSSLGYTTSTYEVTGGRVFDADVELHLERIENGGFSRAAIRAVLLSIATHEAGHFLGLAHSDDPDAVMAARYNDRDLLERPLTQDDVDGICDIFPPEGMPNKCSEPGVSEAALGQEACTESALEPDGSSCAVAHLGSRHEQRGWPALAALGLMLAYRRRRSASCA